MKKRYALWASQKVETGLEWVEVERRNPYFWYEFDLSQIPPRQLPSKPRLKVDETFLQRQPLPFDLWIDLRGNLRNAQGDLIFAA